MKKNYTSKLLIVLSSLLLVSCGGNDVKPNGFVDDNKIEENEEQRVIDNNINNNETNNEDTNDTHTEEIKEPEHVHTIVKEEVKPTCTEGGYLKEECSDENCDYSKYEEYDALGHNIVNEVNSSTHISYGNHFEKAKAYSMCSRCKTKYEPFEYGTSTFAYDSFLDDYCDKQIKCDENLKKEVKTVYKTVSDEISYHFNNSVYEDKDDYENKIFLEIPVSIQFMDSVNIKCFYDLYKEQNPWLTDPTMFTPNSQMYYYYDYKKLRVSFPYYKGNHTPALRKNKLRVFDSIYSKCDSLIRKGASEIERIIAIFSVVGSTIKYSNDRSNLFDTLRNKNYGNCQAFARLFVHLCNRYGIASFYQTNYNHAFNRVCVGNRWYFLEPQGFTQNYPWDKYKSFLSTDYLDRRENTVITLEREERMGNIENLKNGFFSLYKNNELLGVYYDIDETLKDYVQDSEADYKIVLGLTSVCNGKVQYAQSGEFLWAASYADAKYQSLLFTTEENNIKNSGKTNLNISSELLDNENVTVADVNYEVI